MEGANGKILDTQDSAVVIKKIHRHHRAHQRSGSLTAEQQARMQEWARGVCHSAGFKLLFVPRAWDADKYQYKMDRIYVDKPLEVLDAKSLPVFDELKVFYATAKACCIFPADYELYVQPDGRVAMVDFDKFATWSPKGEVLFPWGLQCEDKTLLEPLGLC